MKEFSLPYHDTHLSLKLPEVFSIDYLTPETATPRQDILEAIQLTLDHPLGKRKLQSFIGASSIGIAINDKTRPVPDPNPIEMLLDYLKFLGFNREQITLYIGSGTHTPMQEDEFTKIISEEVIEDYRIVVHDCDQTPMVNLGETHHHTPILINEDFYQSDLKITVGNIEPHHFMGFSGGVKTAAIGLASRETINKNHAMLSHPQAKSGVYHNNPMRQDIEEIGRKAGIHYTLGTILNEQQQILEVFFGDPAFVMKRAIPLVRQYFGIRVPRPYDLVIASPGGKPKDINLYQSQKGLTQAARITKAGGWIVLLAACPEGSGSASYETYIQSMPSHQAVIDQFQNGFFQVGPHKAFQIARDVIRTNFVLVSDIPPQRVKGWKLTPSSPQLLQPLIDWIAARLPSDARVAILPAATRTITEVTNDKP